MLYGCLTFRDVWNWFKPNYSYWTIASQQWTTKMWVRHLRMKKESFLYLCRDLRPHLDRDVARTFKGGELFDNFMIAMMFLSNFNFTPTDRLQSNNKRLFFVLAKRSITRSTSIQFQWRRCTSWSSHLCGLQ